MEQTLYRRPLPGDAIAFSSVEGRKLFAEALAAGGLDGYFPLAEQFHTQSEPAYCGLGSLVVALNALAIDPGRLWKGPWRWFGEELLDCCVPLAEVRERGLSVDELACLARCNGADVEIVRGSGDTANLDAWRAALREAAGGGSVLIASYDRGAMGQTGSGHFSPIGGYHAARDLALVLDVARFKYPPHWVSAERLWRAMEPIDAATGISRGFLRLRARTGGLALGFSFKCTSGDWRGFARRLEAALTPLLAAEVGVAPLAHAVVPMLANLELRSPTAVAHQAALERARAELRALPIYARVNDAVGEERAEAVSLLLLTSVGVLSPAHAAKLIELGSGVPEGSPLAGELANLRAQLAALRDDDASPRD